MEIVKVLEILNNHILKLEEDNQFQNWEIERLRKENNHLKDYVNKEYEEIKS